MAANIVTVEDLENFKQEMLAEIEKLLSKHQSQPARKWLKSHQVMRMLAISPGTLQHLRLKGVLPFSKVGGVIYYDLDDIQQMLDDHKQHTDWNKPFMTKKDE